MSWRVKLDAMPDEEYPNLARLVEITSDAVAITHLDGAVLHVNQQFLSLVAGVRGEVIGADIKDFLFSPTFERSVDHRLPFSTDGEDNRLMLKLSDGSFIPVTARSLLVRPLSSVERHEDHHHVLLVVKSLEEQYARDRMAQSLLSELQRTNKRLEGTLRLIVDSIDTDNLFLMLKRVLNGVVDTLEADGSLLYFLDASGFKLRGISESLRAAYAPDFVSYGSSIGSYILRTDRLACFDIVPLAESADADFGKFIDVETKDELSVRLQDMPPFRSVVLVPIHYGSQPVALLELGWRRTYRARPHELDVLRVVSKYLSIQLIGCISSIQSRRTAALNRSLNRVRDLLFTMEEDGAGCARELTMELRRTLNCHVCPVVFDRIRDSYVIDFEGGSRLELPGTVEELFFSSTAPASRARTLYDVIPGVSDAVSAPTLKSARVVRIDASSRVGVWLARHGLPSQGAFVDMGVMEPPVTDRSSAAPTLDADTESLALFDEHLSSGTLSSCFMLLRFNSQEPIDNQEYDYLLRMVHDFELIEGGVRSKKQERRIAQTLQAGMRSSLGQVPGITTDCLYSSATQQALVGGDFYTLIRLPDERAVMILGDVSGKGVEAASMSALVKTALTAYAWEGRGPVALARSLNSMLMGFSRVETFATMFIAKIDLRARTAVYCSAGHPPTMLARPPRQRVDDPSRIAPGEVELLSCQSGVVGAFENMVYEPGVFTFEPGDVLFMYTDGAIEARNAEGEFFGEQRLRDALLRECPSGATGLCSHILGELDEFTDSALDDDIALVALEFD